MRFALLAGALAIALTTSDSAHADSSVLTYHGALDRSGRYVVPGLTYERARGLHLDASFHPSFRGAVYAQPLLWRKRLTPLPDTAEGIYGNFAELKLASA